MASHSGKLTLLLSVLLLVGLGAFRFVAFTEETTPALVDKEQKDEKDKDKDDPKAGKAATEADQADDEKDDSKNQQSPSLPPEEIADSKYDITAVAAPPFTPGIFPCSNCHDDLEPNRTQRTLKRKHSEIVLAHDEGNRWCLDCHTSENLDMLHLASGKLVDFKESHKLCGQCHGPRYRDWKAGEHGKRSGSWSGKKQYLLCVHCHNPHDPEFKPIKPLPPPVRQGELK